MAIKETTKEIAMTITIPNLKMISNPEIQIKEMIQDTIETSSITKEKKVKAMIGDLITKGETTKGLRDQISPILVRMTGKL